ncbi:hypothetical protein, partial [Clostridium argentinense]|uniref:hypothetical protein n=1 Tax=Clostridium argentinense TaxID=29341 RepID=UPI001969B62D
LYILIVDDYFNEVNINILLIPNTMFIFSITIPKENFSVSNILFNIKKPQLCSYDFFTYNIIFS